MASVSHPSHNPYPLHSANAEVRRRTGCPPLSETIRRIRLFGHIERAGQEMDHCRYQQPSTGLEKAKRMASSTGPKLMEQTCSADSYVTVWGPLLMMMQLNGSVSNDIRMLNPGVYHATGVTKFITKH